MNIIIRQLWGGLGDNLQFSTLPELYAQQGHDVYIHRGNVVRNPEIHDLVWGYNPYIKGYSDETPNCGAPDYYHLSHPCIVTAWEKWYGFGEVNKYPKIYYDCQKVDELKDKVLLDLGFTSTHFDTTASLMAVQRLLLTKYADREILQVSFQPEFSKDAYVCKSQFRLKGVQDFVVRNIYESCDAIHSCHAFITLFSGGSVLASAIKQDDPGPVVHVFKPPRAGMYIFENINYIDII